MKIKRLPRLLFQIWGMEQLFDVFGLNMPDMQNVSHQNLARLFIYLYIYFIVSYFILYIILSYILSYILS